MHPYHNRIIVIIIIIIIIMMMMMMMMMVIIIIIINFIKVSKPCNLGEPILIRGHILV